MTLSRYSKINIIKSSYRIKPPLVRRSRLTYVENGGVGKELSDGWAANYVVGCSHGCIFCYVDSIIKRSWRLYGEVVKEDWGRYLLIPENLEEAIKATPWMRWSGKEVLLSSMHDPYLPEIKEFTRMILELALPHGVRFCIQTRSTLVLKDFDLLEDYKDQVRIQVSLPTMNEEFAKMVEPNVPLPKARLEVLRRAKERGFRTGVIIAPIFPPNPSDLSYNPLAEIDKVFEAIAEVKPDYVYGECLHIRGLNKRYIAEKTGFTPYYDEIIDKTFEKRFYRRLKEYGLKGSYWPEHKRRR